jgi:MFS family permease
VPVFANLARVAEARAKRVGRHLGVRAALIAGCALAATIAGFFVLAALTVALAGRYGWVDAFAIMAGLGLLVLALLLLALAREARRHRLRAAARQGLDRQLYQAALLSAMPRRMPSRPVAGLLLVAAGALLVLMRGRGSGDAD